MLAKQFMYAIFIHIVIMALARTKNSESTKSYYKMPFLEYEYFSPCLENFSHNLNIFAITNKKNFIAYRNLPFNLTIFMCIANHMKSDLI